MIEFKTNRETDKIFTVKFGSISRPSRASRPIKRAPKSVAQRFKKAIKAAFKKKKPKKKPKQKRLSNLSSNTSPRKSNLTATGELLDSIVGYGRKAKIIIEITNTTSSDSLTDPLAPGIGHADLVRIHERGAKIKHPSGTTINLPKRRFFDLSNAEKKGLIRFVRQFILQITRSRLG